MKISKIIIHCSDTPNGRDDSAEDINRWHIEKGMDGIGYHYVIRVDGALENGRPEFWKGAHAYGHNSNSIGICLIGRDEYSSAQWRTLCVIVSRLTKKYKGAEVFGHNEISDKSCPGFDVKKSLMGEINSI